MGKRLNSRSRFRDHQQRRRQNAEAPPPPRGEQEILTELRELCRSPGYAHIVAHLIIRDNFVFYRDEMTAENMQNLYGFKRLIRTEISTLIGYMVQEGADALGPPPPDPQGLLQRTEALLEELHYRLNWRTIEQFRAGLSEGPLAKGGEAMREPIFYAGESAFSFQYADFAVPKYARDNDWLFENRGFRIEDAAKVVASLLEAEPDALRQAMDRVRESDGREWSLLSGFNFSIDDLCARLDLPGPVVRAVVDAFSLPEGPANAGFNDLHDFNATSATPLIPLGDGNYALLQHYALVEALYESPFYWMGADKAYCQTAFTNRGAFTEDFTFERLRAVFGAANVHRNLNLERGKGTRVGEIDILVEYGGRLIVVQAKSKRLTIGARRGNDGQLRADFKAAVQDAYDQAMLCAEALFDAKVRITTADGEPFSLSQPITKVYPLCLVADHYPGLVFQTDQFLAKREIPKVGAAIVTDIFALDTLCEMLDRPLRLLGYLELRDRFGSRLLYSHEIVLLSYHLKQNLWVEDQYDSVMLEDNVGADLEIAMLARRRSIPGARTPAGILTAFPDSTFDKLISRIEDQPEVPMVDLALLLLEASGTIKAFNEGASVIAAQARADLKVHDFSMAMGAVGLTVHCSYEPAGKARDRLSAHCQLRKYSVKADRWFGLFLNPADGLPIAGVQFEYPWTEDATLAAMASGLRPAASGPSLARARPRGEVGRNDPCPCGSGFKFKKCCLRASQT